MNKIASSSTNFFSEGYSILRQRFGNDSFWLHGPYHYIMKAIFQVGRLIVRFFVWLVDWMIGGLVIIIKAMFHVSFKLMVLVYVW